MATAAAQNYVFDLGEIYLKRNDTFKRKLIGLTDSEGVAWDFENIFVSARANAINGQGVTIVSFSTDSGTLDMSVPGELSLSLTKINTDKTPGRYNIDFEFRTLGNEDYTLYKAIIVVEDDITK